MGHDMDVPAATSVSPGLVGRRLDLHANPHSRDSNQADLARQNLSQVSQPYMTEPILLILNPRAEVARIVDPYRMLYSLVMRQI
jgi:hypothetical protein